VVVLSHYYALQGSFIQTLELANNFVRLRRSGSTFFSRLMRLKSSLLPLKLWCLSVGSGRLLNMRRNVEDERISSTLRE
jgi:hypothetical protein